MNSKCNSPVIARLLQHRAALLLVLSILATALIVPEAALADKTANYSRLIAQGNDGPAPFGPQGVESGPEPGGPNFGRAVPGMDAPEGQGGFRRGKRWRNMQGGPGPGPNSFNEPAGPGGFPMGAGRGFEQFKMRRGNLGPGMGAGVGGRFSAGGRRLDLTPLNLTEQQKTRIQSLREQTRTQAKEIRKSLFQKQMRLRDLLFSADATDAQIMAARRDMRDWQDKMDEINVKDMLAIRGVLTAEQKAKLPMIMPGRRDTVGGGMPAGSMQGGQPGAWQAGAPRRKLMELRNKAKVAGQTPPQE